MWTTLIETEPHGDLGAVLQRLEVVLGSAVGWIATATPCSSASRPWPDTWSARVRLEDTLELHTLPLGRFEILLDREGRIDHDCLAGGVVADQVGGAAKIVVDELAKSTKRSYIMVLMELKTTVNR